MRSNHLNIRSFWKSLVASCVCVRLRFERVLSASSSQAQIAFVCNVISYLEASSRDYLVSSV